MIFRQGFKQVQIQGVEFRQLGQGGLKGRFITRDFPLLAGCPAMSRAAASLETDARDGPTVLPTAHARSSVLVDGVKRL